MSGVYVIDEYHDSNITRMWKNRAYSDIETVKIIAEVFSLTVEKVLKVLNAYGHNPVIPRHLYKRQLPTAEMIRPLIDRGLSIPEIIKELDDAFEYYQIWNVIKAEHWDFKRVQGKRESIPFDIVKDCYNKGMTAEQIRKVLNDKFLKSSINAFIRRNKDKFREEDNDKGNHRIKAASAY